MSGFIGCRHYRKLFQAAYFRTYNTDREETEFRLYKQLDESSGSQNVTKHSQQKEPVLKALSSFTLMLTLTLLCLKASFISKWTMRYGLFLTPAPPWACQFGQGSTRAQPKRVREAIMQRSRVFWADFHVQSHGCLARYSCWLHHSNGF